MSDSSLFRRLIMRVAHACKRQYRKLHSAPLDTTHSWHRVPPSMTGRRVCVLVSYSRDGTLSRHTQSLGQAWHDQGFMVVLVVATESLTNFVTEKGAWPFFAGILLRHNSGYDFGSWATALLLREDLHDAALLALANDSVYGPLEGFAQLIQRAEQTPHDVVGVTESLEFKRHFQSYLIFYKPRALKSQVFSRFWRSIKGDGRERVIEKYEMRQISRMIRGGLTAIALFPAQGPIVNPTIVNWRGLLEQGFPFVKVQLLKAKSKSMPTDNVDWERAMEGQARDTAAVIKHLAG